MRILILALIAALSLISPATASQERHVPWSEVSLVATAPAPFGAVKIEAKSDPSTGRLTSLQVHLGDGRQVKMPSELLADLDAPRLHELKTGFEVGYDPTPWFYIHVPYGEAILLDKQYRWRVVTVAIQDDRAIYRAIKTPRAGGQFDWKQEAIPAP